MIYILQVICFWLGLFNIQLQTRSLFLPSGTSEAHLWDECQASLSGISRVVDGWREAGAADATVCCSLWGGKAVRSIPLGKSPQHDSPSSFFLLLGTDDL